MSTRKNSALIRVLPLWISFPVAAASGLFFSWAFPAASIWPLSLVVPVLLFWCLVGRRGWLALSLGFLFALVFWLSLINWLTLYLGPVPWLALGVLQAIFYAIAVALMAPVINSAQATSGRALERYVLIPATLGAIWAAKEVLTSLWPYGGYSWGKVAQAQADSPFAHDISWLATSGLSFVLVGCSALVFQLLRDARISWAWLTPVAILVVLWLTPGFAITPIGHTTVLAVQGNSKAGLFDDRSSGDILNDHVSTTLSQHVDGVDVIVWPENAADINPLDNRFARQLIEGVSAEFNAPIVTGTITQDNEGKFFNSSVVIDAQQGVLGQYDKVHPVPFAEYMPDRDFWHALQPDLVDLVQYDYSIGDRPSVIDIGGVPTGIQICFDVTDDVLSRELIDQGGQYIVLQTNNADFGKTVESEQQLAITKLRAIETGRSIVSVSTVGASAIYSPQGELLNQIPAHQRGAMTSDVSLATTVTPAIFFGPVLDMGVVVLAISGLLLIVIRRKF